MATHSTILAWRIPWTEEPGGLQSMGSQESDTTQRLNHQCPQGASMLERVSESHSSLRLHFMYITLYVHNTLDLPVLRWPLGLLPLFGSCE